MLGAHRHLRRIDVDFGRRHPGHLYGSLAQHRPQGELTCTRSLSSFFLGKFAHRFGTNCLWPRSSFSPLVSMMNDDVDRKRSTFARISQLRSCNTYKRATPLAGGTCTVYGYIARFPFGVLQVFGETVPGWWVTRTRQQAREAISFSKRKFLIRGGVRSWLSGVVPSICAAQRVLTGLGSRERRVSQRRIVHPGLFVRPPLNLLHLTFHALVSFDRQPSPP